MDLGELHLSGFFPLPGVAVPSMPLTLAKCSNCGLSQLKHQLPVTELYGSHYGYESHLNFSMSRHLQGLAKKLEKMSSLKSGDVVLDIASNDGTLLAGYESEGLVKVGIDPLIGNLKDFYPDSSMKINKFFSAEAYESLELPKAKIITSCSVFYDLDNPKEFAENVATILDPSGMWVLEQSYYWNMIDALSFDTICHEHLLYLRLIDIDKICQESGLSIFDIEFNNTNGGSIQVYVQKANGIRTRSAVVDWHLKYEGKLELDWTRRVLEFQNSVKFFMQEFRTILQEYKSRGFYTLGLGASTKGNVLLEACSVDSTLINFIGEINPKKFGRVTPGTQIPIIDQERVFDFPNEEKLIVILPWHFSKSIMDESKVRLEPNSRFLVPLPKWPTLLSPYGV